VTRTLVGRVVERQDGQDGDRSGRAPRKAPALRQDHRRSSKYHAHDENGDYQMGDIVEISEVAAPTVRRARKTSGQVTPRCVETSASDLIVMKYRASECLRRSDRRCGMHARLAVVRHRLFGVSLWRSWGRSRDRPASRMMATARCVAGQRQVSGAGSAVVDAGGIHGTPDSRTRRGPLADSRRDRLLPSRARSATDDAAWR